MSARRLGIDVGSTTVKLVLMEDGNLLVSRYERHLARARETVLRLLEEEKKLLSEAPFTVAVSGSAGMGLAQAANLPFVQEVYATGETVRALQPDTGVVIELGGEDAKVIFYTGGFDERMNGTCAGGTGAFIDQMAVLLDVSVAEMDELSLQAERLYPIASRCGVFAKTDIQPLLNQGAAKSDVAASIYQAVVNQTITGLIQGRKIQGKVMFLGGPLYYCKGLRKRFTETLKLDENTAVFPEWGRFSVAIGAALSGEGEMTLPELKGVLEESAKHLGGGLRKLPPLFESEEEYAAFVRRHSAAAIPAGGLASYEGDAWLGVDCGSTTTKLVLISDKKSVLYSYYAPNRGDPVTVVREQLEKIYDLIGDRIRIRGSALTGYGEDLIRHAFHMDRGLVETIAHYTAAREFRPDVDFILDIGGQDIKCFRIRNGAIDSIMLNEACSSGCGSFIATFALSMNREVEEFAREGLFAKEPVDLGSRCTVFMNSSVKQAQKDGATVADISAGLSVSVVKNAIYKVIRASSASELGQHIVVQGGTFLNDAVLRAFEREIGGEVIRPALAGLMGAYGAALSAMDLKESTILGPEDLKNFTHKSAGTTCKGCANHCRLTINTFADGGRFISGNRCEKPLGNAAAEKRPNVWEWKRNYFENLKPVAGPRGKIGLPLALSMWELAPLWHGLFTALGFEAVFTPLSTRRTYERGQFTIPSDTVCYPAKLMHGHIAELLEMKDLKAIFYPGLTYNIIEPGSDNHFNCPVVAYYAELLHGNIEELRNVRFLYPYLSVDSERKLLSTIYPTLKELDPSISRREAAKAVRAGFEAYHTYTRLLREEGEKAVRVARDGGYRIMVLAGRPYHTDPEIGHGIDRLATGMGFAVVSEDSIAHLAPAQKVHVLDQWTFHSRLYRAAAWVRDNADAELVQLVSFGCGIDAITTDEVREMLENAGKYYTQIKIDEITNLGAVRVRLRSLLGAVEEKERREGGGRHAG